MNWILAAAIIVIGFELSGTAGRADVPEGAEREAVVDDFRQKAFEIGGIPGKMEEKATNPDRSLRQEAAFDGDSPLFSVGHGMREAESLLRRSDSGEKTQRIQAQIIGELDRLINEARKSLGQFKAGADSGVGQGKVSRRGRVPSNDRRKGDDSGEVTASGQVDMREMDRLLKKLWGKLPSRSREQMLELPVEEFLPKYEIMIEDYFRQLSKEKTGQ